MPADDRISALLDALSGDLSQEKLESLSKEFDSLAQDRPESLPTYQNKLGMFSITFNETKVRSTVWND
jgi:hypothetical protein